MPTSAGAVVSPQIDIELWPRPQPGGHRHRVGLRTLDRHRWVVVDGTLAAVLAGKEALLASRHHDVVMSMPGSEPAQWQCTGAGGIVTRRDFGRVCCGFREES
jgi:hypothetical protein